MSATPNKNTHFLCKNLNGTSQDVYSKPKDGCSSWLQHWRQENPNSTRNRCSVSKKYCQGVRTGSRQITAGAHVLVYDERRNESGKWCIIPVCAACNSTSNTGEFWVTQQIRPVLVTAKH